MLNYISIIVSAIAIISAIGSIFFFAGKISVLTQYHEEKIKNIEQSHKNALEEMEKRRAIDLEKLETNYQKSLDNIGARFDKFREEFVLHDKANDRRFSDGEKNFAVIDVRLGDIIKKLDIIINGQKRTIGKTNND